MTLAAANPIFVSTTWLAENLGAPDVVAIDASFHLPSEKRDAKTEYQQGHIPGAVFFEIDAIADHRTDLPHMLPSPENFALAMKDLGLGHDMRLVVYDSSNLQGGARVWWTLRIYGARDVKILAGGLPRWCAEGRPLERGTVQRPRGHFQVDFDPTAVADAKEVEQASQTASVQILDARSAARFTGAVPEPRPNLRSGHIPGSFNLPWDGFVAEGELRSPDEVKARLAKARIDLSRPIITTCGSGVTAAILLLALASIGKNDVRLYDGSWAEWGASSDLKVVVGE
ncbi:MAG: 3-mercaptopyruvate sulfurtransferase [Alphaproteobacteria bacterium]|nr:3-mercaptopyruvate sulfurtransferase [Alphaproteobacteria bacterium]